MDGTVNAYQFSTIIHLKGDASAFEAEVDRITTAIISKALSDAFLKNNNGHLGCLRGIRAQLNAYLQTRINETQMFGFFRQGHEKKNEALLGAADISRGLNALTVNAETVEELYNKIYDNIFIKFKSDIDKAAKGNGSTRFLAVLREFKISDNQHESFNDCYNRGRPEPDAGQDQPRARLG